MAASLVAGAFLAFLGCGPQPASKNPRGVGAAASSSSKRKADAPRPPLPTSVAGIPFGATPGGVGVVCERSGGKFLEVDGGVACTRQPVPNGLGDAGVLVTFCASSSCEIIIPYMARPSQYPDDRSPALAAHIERRVDEIARATDQLVGKYGEPDIAEGPKDCQGPFDFRLRLIWLWPPTAPGGPPGGRMLLAYSCGREGGTFRDALSIIYDNEAGAAKRWDERRTRDANF